MYLLHNCRLRFPQYCAVSLEAAEVSSVLDFRILLLCAMRIRLQNLAVRWHSESLLGHDQLLELNDLVDTLISRLLRSSYDDTEDWHSSDRIRLLQVRTRILSVGFHERIGDCNPIQRSPHDEEGGLRLRLGHGRINSGTVEESGLV